MLNHQGHLISPYYALYLTFRAVVGMPPAPTHLTSHCNTRSAGIPRCAHFPRYLHLRLPIPGLALPVGWGSNPPVMHACMQARDKAIGASLPNESRQHAPEPTRPCPHASTYPRRSPHRPDLGAAAEYSHHSIPLCTEGLPGSPLSPLLGRTTYTLSDGLG